MSMPIEKVMYTVKQRAVGNNERLQDGTRTNRPTRHGNRTSIEIQQQEAEETTSQAEVFQAVAELEEVDFPVAEEVAFREVEAVGEDADKLRSFLLFFNRI